MGFLERSRRFVSKRTSSFRRSIEVTPRAVHFVIGLGVDLRIGAWAVLPPVWKTHVIFNPVHMPVVEYVSNFEGYKPSRMPFFDVFSAAF